MEKKYKIEITGTGTKEELIASLEYTLVELRLANDNALEIYRNLYWDEYVEVKIDEV